jgi:hypothetical protein
MAQPKAAARADFKEGLIAHMAYHHVHESVNMVCAVNMRKAITEK